MQDNIFHEHSLQIYIVTVFATDHFCSSLVAVLSMAGYKLLTSSKLLFVKINKVETLLVLNKSG